MKTLTPEQLQHIEEFAKKMRALWEAHFSEAEVKEMDLNLCLMINSCEYLDRVSVYHGCTNHIMIGLTNTILDIERASSKSSRRAPTDKNVN